MVCVDWLFGFYNAESPGRSIMEKRSWERGAESAKKIIESLFFLLIRENEIRFLREGWLVDLWHGLVWFRSWCFTTYTHVNLGVLAWAQCDKRGCDVVSLSFLPRTRFPPLLVLRKDKRRFEPDPDRQKEQWNPKKVWKLNLPVQPCRGRGFESVRRTSGQRSLCGFLD